MATCLRERILVRGFMSARGIARGMVGVLATALAVWVLPAAAAGFPERDITFIIPNQVGGGFDAYVRAIAPVMEKYLPNKVNVLPLNVPAGGGAKGVNQLYRARPDGYTIGIMNIPGLFILQERGGGYDLNKFTWLAGLGKDPYALAVPWNSPIKTVADLQALSKTRPVKFTTNGPEGTAYGVTHDRDRPARHQAAAHHRLQGLVRICGRRRARRRRRGHHQSADPGALRGEPIAAHDRDLHQ